MTKPTLNRIKMLLVEKKRTSKDLAKAMERQKSTVSRWCTNQTQPSVEMLYKIAKYLDVDVRELLVPSKKGRSNS